MKVVTFIVGLVGLVSALAHIFTQNDLFFKIFIVTMPYIWGVVAFNEWKEGRKGFSIFLMVVTLASLVMLGDLVFSYL